MTEPTLAAAVALLQRVLDDENFGIGLSRDIHKFLYAYARAECAYPEFCRNPDACRGKGYCPLDPTCAD